MNFFKFLTLTVSIVLLVSCQKEELTERPGPHAPGKSSTDLWPAAANTQNPYEDLAVGVYHNQALNYYRDQRPHYNSQQQWMNDAYQITLDFFCAQSDQRYCDPEMTADELAGIVDTALEDSLWAIRLETFPVEVSAYVDKLWMVFEDYPVSNYSLFKKEVMELESAIAGDGSLNEDDRKMLLCATQVARYSAYYWKEAVTNGFADWNMVDISMDQKDMSRVAKADIRGSIVGYGGSSSLKRSAKGGPISSARKSNDYIQVQ